MWSCSDLSLWVQRAVTDLGHRGLMHQSVSDPSVRCLWVHCEFTVMQNSWLGYTTCSAPFGVTSLVEIVPAHRLGIVWYENGTILLRTNPSFMIGTLDWFDYILHTIVLKTSLNVSLRRTTRDNLDIIAWFWLYFLRSSVFKNSLIFCCWTTLPGYSFV